MSFRPSVHGWPFQDDRSREPSARGAGAHPLSGIGLAGGMCWTALDRYLGGVRVDSATPRPEPGEPLHAEIVRRQTAALSGVWSRVRATATAADHPALPFLAPPLARQCRSEWRAIRRSLDHGRPVLLTLLPVADGYARGHAALQVLATGWARDGRRIRVQVYDPARPGDDDVALSFALRGPLDARMSGGRSFRAFFAVPYDRVPGPVLRAESFADRAVLGLNRAIRGRAAVTAAKGRLDVVARDPDGALVHFVRRRGARWEGGGVTGVGGLDARELHSDPAAVLSGRRLHVFARSYVGDLLHFRLGRRWVVANLTENRRAGPRFRLAGEPVPAAGGGRRLAVAGRDQEGGLVVYHRAALGGWAAEQVPGEPIAAGPSALWIGDALHIAGVTRDGRLLAWTRGADGAWVAFDVSTGREHGALIRVAGTPATIVRGAELHVFARDADGGLAHFHRAENGRWTGAVRAHDVTGDPVATTGPGGIHVFAAGEDGLTHVWGETDWHAEDILATRPTLAAAGPARGPLVAWGDHAELRLLAIPGDEPLVLLWRADRDWTAIPLTAVAGVQRRHLPAAHLVLADDGGSPHLFGTDGRGTLVHLEEGPWSEPAPSPAPGVRGGSAERVAARPPSRPTAAAPHAEPGPERSSEAAPSDGAAEPAPAAESPDDGSEQALDLESIDLASFAVAAPRSGAGEAGELDAGTPDPGVVAGGPAGADELEAMEVEPFTAGVDEFRSSAPASPEPVAEPSPEPVAEPSPEPVAETSPEPVGEPSPGALAEPSAGAGVDASEDAGTVARNPAEAATDTDDLELHDFDPGDLDLGPLQLEAVSVPDPEVRERAAGHARQPPTAETPSGAAEDAPPPRPDEADAPYPWELGTGGQEPGGGAEAPESAGSERAASEGAGSEEGGGPGGGESEEGEAEGCESDAPKSEPAPFPWENVAGAGERPERHGNGGAPDVEPMDLSLLDSWPPEAPVRKGSRRRDDR